MKREGAIRGVAKYAMLIACTCVPAFATAAGETFEELAAQCAPGIHPQTLAAVVGHESNFDPLAIGVKGVSVKVRTLEEAVSSASRLIAEGRSVDMGLGQINAANLRRLGLTVREVFDPCINLAAAARILTENYQEARKQFGDEQAALNAALSQYNTGNRVSGLKNGYVAKVRKQAGLPPPIIPSPPAVATPLTPSPAKESGQANPYAAFGAENQAKYDAFSRPRATAVPLSKGLQEAALRAIYQTATAIPSTDGTVASQARLQATGGADNGNLSSTRLSDVEGNRQ